MLESGPLAACVLSIWRECSFNRWRVFPSPPFVFFLFFFFLTSDRWAARYKSKAPHWSRIAKCATHRPALCPCKRTVVVVVSQPIYLPPVGFFRPATHTQHSTEAHTHRRLCTHPTETLVYSISIDRLRFSLSDASQIRNKYDKKQIKIKLERNYQLARDGRRVTRSIFRLLFGAGSGSLSFLVWPCQVLIGNM